MINKNLEKFEYNEILNILEANCRTYIGKEISKNLSPSSDSIKVQKTLDETTEALNLIHELGSFPISSFEDLSMPVKKLESEMILSPKYLLLMAEVLKTSRELKDYFSNSKIESKYLFDYFDNLYTNIDIEKKIFSSIISESEISDNASSKLASLRKTRKNIESGIKDKLNKIIHSNTYSKYIMESIITIRNDRFVIPVKEEYRNQVKGFIHDTSSSGSTVYIEPLAIFEMNNSINNYLIEESHEIDRILQSLTYLLTPIVSFLKQNINLIGKLDFISAKANLSIKYDCSCPEIKDYIDLKNARHPLISKDKVVPTTLYLGKNNITTLVITGPNTGGKTVTLKTVGLLCSMAQSGLHIPVSENSSIKIFDNIFADIGDDQSIEASLSTFSSHMTNIIKILNSFTNNSLILVDELGSGTDPIEGANLAISLLETFHNKGAFTIATTHYHEIKNYCISHDGFENASVEFDIKNLKPTYHLLLGIPGKSNAFSICKKLGIPKEIIDRASSLISKPDTDIETLLKQIYDNKIEQEKIKEEQQKNLNQIEMLRKQLEKENDEKLKQEREKIDEAKKEAKQILIDAKEEANRIIRELSSLEKNDLKKANNLRNQLNNSLDNMGGNSLDLSVLLKLNNKEIEKANTKKSNVHFSNKTNSNISAEINIIGENVDSAIEILDKYLDNASVAHLHQVRIIHGKGTGKLREGIHQYLRKSKYVTSFNLAGYGEGDYGVTIAYLK